MSDWFERLKAERDEVMKRYENLTYFMESVRWANLGRIHRMLLSKQRQAMQDYINILDVRIHILELEAK